MSAKVLDSYQGIGSRFVPPMLQLFGFDYVSWLSQTMPELVWWNVLIKTSSLGFAIRIGKTIAEHFVRVENRAHWWAFTSDFDGLSAESIEQLVGHLARRRILGDLQSCLGDFLNLYPACPLATAFGLIPSGLPDVAYLSKFGEQLGTLENKSSKDATFIQAQAIYMGFLSGRFHVPEGFALRDLPELLQYPETDRSRTVAGAVRASINTVAGRSLPAFRADAWVQYFWRRSLELHLISLRHLEQR